MDYKKAINAIVNERNRRLADAQTLYLDLLRNNSELYSVEKEIRSVTMDGIKGMAVDKARLERLKIKREDILRALGVTNEMLNPPYMCDICHDTGLHNGKPCACVMKRSVSDGMLVPDMTFDKADLEIFPISEQERIAKVYATAKAFCDKFPFTKRLNVLLIGGCGSGKTFLASCIANEISAKGMSVIMLSSFAFNNRMLKYHTTFDEDKLGYLEPLLDCDLLVIDDLGSENMLKNVTSEYLFHVVNERMTSNKHTVFTTNLDDNMICARYGERTFSRLFGSKLSFGFALSDYDLRNCDLRF